MCCGPPGQVFFEDRTGHPEWVTTKTGMFGGESFVPLRDAEVAGDDAQVPYSKDKVKDAPRIEAFEGHLSKEEEGTLNANYGENGSAYDSRVADADPVDKTSVGARVTTRRDPTPTRV